jgi:predicted RNA-binding Zn ribbon-like protein
MFEPTLNPPFEYTGGHIAIDFVDTVNGRHRKNPHNLLSDYSRLLQWSEESGTLPGKLVDRLRKLAADQPARAQSVLRQAIHLREALYEIFSAMVERRAIPPAALVALNKAIQHAAAHAEVMFSADHFSREWIDSESHLDAMLWRVAQAAGDLLTSGDVNEIRQCAADDCLWLFLDKTKNHRRRWCEMKTCGNRDKARRYYHRQKQV